MILFITTCALVYALCAYKAFKYTKKNVEGYYGNKLSVYHHGVPAAFWPVTIPFFMVIFREPISSIKDGKDWADDNLEPKLQEEFRNGYMPESFKKAS